MTSYFLLLLKPLGFPSGPSNPQGSSTEEIVFGVLKGYLDSFEIM